MLSILNLDLRWFCKNLTLHFNKGDVIGILGPNGCGKTTLLHTLAGLIQPENGSIHLGHLNVRNAKRKAIAQRIGLLMQDNPFTFNQTVWDYCAAARYPHHGFWPSYEPHIIHDALTHMELEPLKLRSVTALSGGEKRRLSIAALIAQTPEVYLLDEPTNHLDVRYQMLALRFFQQQALTVMSLHDVNLAQQFCNKLLLLFGDGKTCYGTVDEVLTAENVSKLYRHPMQQEEKVYWSAS